MPQMPFAIVVDRADGRVVLVSVHSTFEKAKQALTVSTVSDARVIVRRGYDK